MLLDTYDPYKPAIIAWPRLEGEALERLTGLPFWDLAVHTEGNAGTRMQALADASEDPLIREAVALNAFEERRHKTVLENMIAFYRIPMGEEPEYPVPDDPEWMFLRTGFGECLDSFFAFGLFKLAKDSGFFPEDLVQVFEPIIQEEARHILFFVNWVAYERRRRAAFARLRFTRRTVAAIAVQANDRLRTAMGVKEGNFTAKSHASMGIQLSPRQFLDTCLAENDRRMARYDERLLRPRMMPRVARSARLLLRR